MFLFSIPPITRSAADWKSSMVTKSLSRLAAIKAASLQRLARSAPENPELRAARGPEYSSTLFSRVNFLKYNSTICFLDLMSGRPMAICRSNRPGLKRAESRTSALFVPARTTIPSFVWNPSISTRSWLRVFSLSSLELNLLSDLLLPTASISSIQMMQGVFFLAFSKSVRTLADPTPTNISVKSDPLIEKNGTSASPATALARRVLPVPGGPTRRAPLGILAPSSVYF
mmetsp:Transcript_48869/g.81316  ORF Transcript_48869/g.81316 Transcript_48869/m.81316 type:complete len:229 (+) Transcript_48869:768-1454(+)